MNYGYPYVRRSPWEAASDATRDAMNAVAASIPFYLPPGTTLNDLSKMEAKPLDMLSDIRAQGDIIFEVRGTEVMRFCEDGIVMVKGREVTADESIVAAFRSWLVENGVKFNADGSVVLG